VDLEQKYENVWISNKDTFYHYIDRKERPWEYIYLIGEKLIHTDKSLALFAYDSPVLLGDSFLITSFPDKVFFVNFKEAFIDEFK
jgi:hypothetical protein